MPTNGNAGAALAAYCSRAGIETIGLLTGLDDAALVGVVSHLDVAGDRKILAERMTNESVVGEQTTQIVVTVEQDAKQAHHQAAVHGVEQAAVGAGVDVGHAVHHQVVLIVAVAVHRSADAAQNRAERAVTAGVDRATEQAAGDRADEATAALIVQTPGPRSRSKH